MHCAQCLTFCDPRDIARQAPLSMRFSRQEYGSKVAISYSRGSSQHRDQTLGPVSPALAGEFFTTELPGQPHSCKYFLIVDFHNEVFYSGLISEGQL